jgi:hypothetical protein
MHTKPDNLRLSDLEGTMDNKEGDKSIIEKTIEAMKDIATIASDAAEGAGAGTTKAGRSCDEIQSMRCDGNANSRLVGRALAGLTTQPRPSSSCASRVEIPAEPLHDRKRLAWWEGSYEE